MDVICLEGEAPGPIVATVAHCGSIRRLAMDVARHPQGGWRIRQGADWGPRSHAVMTAVLLEASEAFADDGAPERPDIELPVYAPTRRENALAL